MVRELLIEEIMKEEGIDKAKAGLMYGMYAGFPEMEYSKDFFRRMAIKIHMKLQSGEMKVPDDLRELNAFMKKWLN